MQSAAEAVGTISDNFWTWILIPLVVVVAGYYTVRTHFAQFTSIPQMFRTITEPAPVDKDGKPQSVNAFQAFTLSAASRVGVGNIAGVGTAIAIGGPGSVFWMWAMAGLVSASSLAESTLAQLFKIKDPDHAFRGGPAYYIEKGIGSKAMAIAFAIALIACFPFAFNSLQANTLADTIARASGTPDALTWVPWVVAVVLAGLVGAIIFGGLHRIASISQAVVPLMALLYLFLGIAVVIVNYKQIPWAFQSIFADAFGIQQFVGAGIGTVIAMGVRRGMFSNEAGLGSVPNAAATAAVTHPAKQGLVQTLGVYFDTWLVCSITAFIILVSSPDLEDAPVGVYLTQTALSTSLGAWTGVFLVIIIALLSFTSILGNYYYGESNIRYITNSKATLLVFRAFVVLAVFLGSVAGADLIWNLADTVMGVMALINLVAILWLSPIAIRLWRDFRRQLKLGKDPVFTREMMPDVKNVECWESYEAVTGKPEPYKH